jgi:hypothetical protein
MQEYVLLGVISRSVLLARLKRMEDAAAADAAAGRWPAQPAPTAFYDARLRQRSSSTVGSPDRYFDRVPEHEVRWLESVCLGHATAAF